MANKFGWGNTRPYDSRSKFHFFVDGRSLCGRWASIFNSIELEDGLDDHPDNCATCKRKVISYRAANEGSQDV